MASASGGGSGGGGVAEYGFGAQEQRWKGTHPRRRVQTPTRNEGGMRMSLGQSASKAAMAALSREEQLNASIAGGGTRRLYAQKQSATYQWKPSLQKVQGRKPPQDRPTGLKQLAEPKPLSKAEAERRHFKAQNARSNKFTTVELGQKKRVTGDSGVPRAERQADEVDVSKVFGRKVRVDSQDTMRLRNGVGVSRPGDKMYSSTDYAPGFFKGGGVYPGSNWGTSLKKYEEKRRKHALAQATMTQRDTIGPRTLTYEQRRRVKMMLDELDEVLALNPESTVKPGATQTWESRTGKFTVARDEDSSDDEAEPETAAEGGDES